MALNKKIFPKVAVAGNGGAAASAEQNLILNLDANDVDSYDGDGSIWYDISEHDLTVPLSDNANDLELHLNASDSTSYNPTSGTTTWSDISGNSRDATMTSMGNSNFDIDNGGYFEFDGSNDYMTVTGNSAFYPTTTTGITVECWFTSDTTDDGENLVNNQSSTGGYRLWSAGSSLYADTFNSSGTRVGRANAGTVSDDTWHHGVFTLENSTSTATLKLYLDGELVDTDASVGTATGTTVQNLNIGRRADVTHDKLDGKIGAVRIYSKVLTASEIGQNYRHGRDYIYTDLVDDTNLELHLDAGNTDSYDPSSDGSTWSDLTTGGHNATLTSMDANQHDEEIGGWFDFDGVNDHAIVSHFSELESSARTYEFWVNFDVLGTQFFAGTYGGSNATRTFLFRMYSDSPNNTIRAQIYNGTGTASEPTGNKLIEAGQWYHIVFVSDNSDNSFKSYVNGELDINQTLSFDVNTSSTEPLSIGRGGSGYTGNRINGKIGQTRFYSSALEADEVMQNYLFTKNNYPNVYHATAVNSPTFSSSYFDFDDTNNTSTDYFSLSNDVLQVLSGKEGMSISAWVNFDTVSGIQNIISTYEGGSTLLFNFSSTNAKFTWYLYGSNFEGSRSPADVFSTGVWTHIVAVFDGSQAHASGTGGKYQAYINGSEITMNTLHTGPNLTEVPSVASNVPLRIAAGFGSGSIGENSFDGKISKVRMYSRAITSAEVTAIYDEGSGN